jgi:hypothetical protein
MLCRILDGKGKCHLPRKEAERQRRRGIEQKRTWAIKSRMRQMREELSEQSEYRMRRSELLSTCTGVV